MNLNSPFRDINLVNKLIDDIKAKSAGKEYKIMEVCGTHTMSISRSGLRSILPENIDLVSGPGCPVCVTSQGEIDLFFELIKQDATIVTFGDLLRIPATDGSNLANARANGADVRIIYSPLDTIKLAKLEPNKKFVFLGVGFETTAPIIAGLAKVARSEGLKNLSILSLCKTMPEVISLLLSDKELLLDGFLCPGHVTAVTGINIYDPIVKAGKAAVIAGFEPIEILDAILEVINQKNSGTFRIENKYKRVVKNEGNPIALQILDEVFKPIDAAWRGIGVLKNSGLGFNDNFKEFDALKVFGLKANLITDSKGCRCGDVLKGKLKPNACPLFKKACTPETPFGPCMVSSEGTCAAYYKFI